MFLKKPSDAVRKDGGEALSYRNPMPVSAPWSGNTKPTVTAADSA